MLVYVLDRDGNPLMPTKNGGKVRHLLKEKKAKITCREPFTIQLLYETTHYTQKVTVGVDTGSRHIGVSATTEKEELFATETQPRGREISKNITILREQRGVRRSRKTRYRKPRFQNRVHSKKAGWLPPSTQATLDCHVHLVNKTASILPVLKVIVEVGKFDFQKMQADLKGLERPRGKDYQNGPQRDYENVKAYVKARDNYECQHCHGKSGDKHLEVHHIQHRSQGGSNAPDNLITLCSKCHAAYHAGELKNFDFKPKKNWNETARTNVIGKRLQIALTELGYNVDVTYGYETTVVRYERNMKKSHVNDAFIVAGNLEARRGTENTYLYKKVRCHNRQLHKMNICKAGIRKMNQSAHTVFGFNLFQPVRFDGVDCFITGKRSTGRMMLKTIDGEKVSDSAGHNKITARGFASGWLIERGHVV